MYLAWCGYKEKVEILYVALEQRNDGMGPIDIVTGLLKGQITADTADAKQSLEQYGFQKDFANRYKKSLYVSWITTIVIFLLLYTGLLVLFVQTDKRQKMMRKKELLWLQEQVTALRDIASGSFLQLDNHQNILEEYDEDLGRFLLEFVSLADSISLFRQQAEIEREETKVLVTDISHQLKTPIAALKTSFEILQSDNLSEAEYQEFLERCCNQILRLEELVSALVNISRMETGMIVLEKAERNLFDTILLAVNRIYPKSEEKAIEIELEAEKELQQVKVFHDPKWLSEAFLNVLENAVKYSANQTKIKIRMIKMTVYLRIEIEDEGIGIPRKEWNRIFQRFYRGEAREVQEESGSGVGLYLAREIVSRHEGTLVVSAPRHKKQGSCFVFQLPYL
ncbi:MAG: HAMP domain-containing histidine kinase [Lachnospiraceae bacterium]|nr:HAMP domain-containing histidine kinase [Lachnospiraceae bacterium]